MRRLVPVRGLRSLQVPTARLRDLITAACGDTTVACAPPDHWVAAPDLALWDGTPPPEDARAVGDAARSAGDGRGRPAMPPGRGLVRGRARRMPAAPSVQ